MLTATPRHQHWHRSTDARRAHGRSLPSLERRVAHANAAMTRADHACPFGNLHTHPKATRHRVSQRDHDPASVLLAHNTNTLANVR